MDEKRICFFFQAEDGIRAPRVTGVQTCALPISGAPGPPGPPGALGPLGPSGALGSPEDSNWTFGPANGSGPVLSPVPAGAAWLPAWPLGTWPVKPKGLPGPVASAGAGSSARMPPGAVTGGCTAMLEVSLDGSSTRAVIPP